MDNIQNLSMDIMDNHIYEVIYTKQYDEGRTIIFNILENGKPFDISGYKAIFQMKKPDGTVIINDYDVTDGKIAISLTNQMTICAGNKIPFQIQLIKNIEDANEKPIILTTVTGYIKVDKSVVQPEDAVSSNEFNALTHALTEVNKIHIKIDNAEKVREANENIRENNEAVRISNETSRNNAEEIRKANENIRNSSETIRSQNEETRQANENIRKSNETARQSDTANAITQANTATKNCVDATTDLQTKLNENYFVLTSDKGMANGVAELNQNGLVPSSQLPGYVDDVIEGYFNDGNFYKDSAFSEDIFGETGKIYVDLETNKTYRWSGNTFIVISETLALGETSSTAYRGDKGKEAFEHSLSIHARVDATKTEKSDINGNIKINDEENLVYKHPVSGATVGSYGDAADQNPNAGESFKVPFISVDDAGHITEINEHTITLPESFLDGDTANNTVSYTSEDAANPAAWTDVSTLASGEKHSSIFNKISKMFKNVRYIWKLLGTTDISGIGNGTVTGAVSSLNTNLTNVQSQIPAVGNGTVVINQSGVQKGSFSLNQSGNATINLTDTNTDTWRPVQNNLSSTSTSDCLSANQGRILNQTKVGSYDANGFQKISSFSKYSDSNNANVQVGNTSYLIPLVASSDERIKENINHTEINALNVINSISHHSFDFKFDEFGKHTNIGYIAQELLDIVPEAVIAVPQSKEKFGYSELYQINYVQLIPYLTKAVQELSEKMEKLSTEIEAMRT